MLPMMPPTDTTTMNFCMACGGHLKADVVTHRDPSARLEYKIVENVPALICQKCGEYFLSNDVVEQISELTEQGQPIRQVVTAFYDFELR